MTVTPYNISPYDITESSVDEWLALRAHDLTASDIGAAIGLDPWKSPLRVYAEKAGLVGPPEDNPAMKRGRDFEDSIAKEVRRKHPDWVVEKAHVYLRDADNRLGATPDYTAEDPDRDGTGNVQIKLINRHAYEHEWIGGRAPIRYELQTLCEAMLLGASWAIVAAYVWETAELVECPVPRHEKAELRIRDIAKNFWLDIEAGRQPPVDYRSDRAVIEAMYPNGGAGQIDLTRHNRIAELCSERLTWQHRKSNAEGALEEVDAEIKAVLGDHDTGIHPEFSISWKLQHRNAVTLPETDFRVLRISRKREKAT